MPPLPDDVLAALRGYSSPTLSNAIELFEVRPRYAGFMDGSIRSIFPAMPPFAGYAATLQIRAAQPGDDAAPLRDIYEYVLSVPGPRVIVVQDLDEPACVGSLWGEVNGNTYKALGAVAVVTDGGVRDLDEVEAISLPLFAREVIVSHAYVRVVGFGMPVTVGGLTVQTGDLLHGDKHGVLAIPPEIAARLPEAVADIERYERGVIAACQSPDFSVDKLLAARAAPRPEIKNY